MAKTLYDKLWDAHLVHDFGNETALIYIDRHIIHEVTSPQAFEGLELAGRKPWRNSANIATYDHNVPTTDRSLGADSITDPVSKLQVTTLDENVIKFNINNFSLQDKRQGIVHVIGPEQGLSLPGMSIVCGDSHTSTHGALGTLAMGIGTSEVEHVLATQTLITQKQKNMLINVEGKLSQGVYAKDLVLYIIKTISTAGATGYAIEFGGEVVRDLSIEARMSICNMSIEAGARVGLVGVDEKTLKYLEDKPYAPKDSDWDNALVYWQTLHSDADAVFDKVININANEITPQVSWGTSPEMIINIDEDIPNPSKMQDEKKATEYSKSLEYMGLKAGQKLSDIELDYIFIGSCTNSRLEDLREAAKIIEKTQGKVNSRIKEALVVPGSGLVKLAAEAEGIDKIFINAGFSWRNSGCSMCLGMNEDRLPSGMHCASTSNRNFEGRQGAGGRTHLVSPAMAAMAAIRGHFEDVSKIL